MDGTEPNSTDLGPVIDELKQGTDHEIALASDAYQGIVDTMRGTIRAGLAESRGEQDLQIATARGAIDQEVDDASGTQRALLNSAHRQITAETLAAQGAANLFGLVQQPPAQPGAPPVSGGTCLVHLLPEPERGIYRELCGKGTQALVYPLNSCRMSPTWVHTFPRWWMAELACRMVNDCHQTVDWVKKYAIVFEHVTLVGQTLAGMGPICPNGPRVIEAWAAANLGASFH